MVATLRLQLRKAATEGKTEEVVRLVEAGADVHSRDPQAAARAWRRRGRGRQVHGLTAHHASRLSDGGCPRAG
jgi:hypothetical protein